MSSPLMTLRAIAPLSRPYDILNGAPLCVVVLWHAHRNGHHLKTVCDRVRHMLIMMVLQGGAAHAGCNQY